MPESFAVSKPKHELIVKSKEIFRVQCYKTFFFCNRTTLIRHQCKKTTGLSCHRYLINTGVEKNEQHLNIDQNFDHQMSLSKSKYWYSHNCLHFFKHAVPFTNVHNKLKCLSLAGLMLGGKARSLPQSGTPESVLQPGRHRHLQRLDQVNKASHGQTLQLITKNCKLWKKKVL